MWENHSFSYILTTFYFFMKTAVPRLYGEVNCNNEESYSRKGYIVVTYNMWASRANNSCDHQLIISQRNGYCCLMFKNISNSKVVHMHLHSLHPMKLD